MSATFRPSSAYNRALLLSLLSWPFSIPPSTPPLFPSTPLPIQSVAVGHPFDTIKTKMQAQEGFLKGPGMVSSFSTVLKTQGLPGLYKVRMGEKGVLG